MNETLQPPPVDTENEKITHVPTPRQPTALPTHISDDVQRKKELLLADEPHELVGFGD